VKTQVGHHWSLRLRPCAAPHPARHELGETPLHGHVHILVAVVGHEGAALDLGGHGRQPVLDGVQRAGIDDAGALQGLGMRQRRLDVLRPQAPV